MDRVRFVDHKGKHILLVDLSGSKGPETSIPVLKAARPIIDSQAPKSVLLLTNCIDTHYDSESADEMKAYSKANTPHIKASAVTGVVGIKRVLFTAVIKLTRRNIKAFDTVDEAMDWLAEQN